MANERDVELLEAFVYETLDTSRLVIEFGDIRARERVALRAATGELVDRQPQLIIAAYRETPDVDLVAAGVVGHQLAAKVELSRAFAELLRNESEYRVAPTDAVERTRETGPRTGNVRRWIKRVRILVGTLKGLLPGAEALGEMLDLLDAALDRPS